MKMRRGAKPVGGNDYLDDVMSFSSNTELNNLFDIPQLDIEDGALLNEDEAWSEAGNDYLDDGMSFSSNTEHDAETVVASNAWVLDEWLDNKDTSWIDDHLYNAEGSEDDD
jgi:hypothetical protein